VIAVRVSYPVGQGRCVKFLHRAEADETAAGGDTRYMAAAWVLGSHGQDFIRSSSHKLNIHMFSLVYT